MPATDKNEHQNKADDKQNSQTEIDETVAKAYEEAEKDIEQDLDFQPDPTTDLDEGEIARLEGED
jgi:hypothetical protein